jgi:hypothetical protein
VIQLIGHTWVEWLRYSFHAYDSSKGELGSILRIDVECQSCKHMKRAPVFSGDLFNLAPLMDAITRHESLKHNARTE